jgi:ribosomal protein S18 acetylase RimI-like enzyme
MLLSNTILNPAISLYQKHGFKTLRQGEHPDYKRCNIEMELQL